MLADRLTSQERYCSARRAEPHYSNGKLQLILYNGLITIVNDLVQVFSTDSNQFALDVQLDLEDSRKIVYSCISQGAKNR